MTRTQVLRCITCRYPFVTGAGQLHSAWDKCPLCGGLVTPERDQCGAYQCVLPARRELGIMVYCDKHYRVRWLQYRVWPRWLGGMLATAWSWAEELVHD